MAVERKAVEFDDQQMTEFKQEINSMDGKISMYVTNLTNEERRSTWKLGPQSMPFVNEVKKCANLYPEFRAGFFDMEKFEKDLNFSTQAADLAKDLAPVLEKLSESAMAAGADAFAAARTFYEAVKAGVKANKPGADAILERLEDVFYKKIPKTKTGKST